MQAMVLTVIGKDKPGLINEIAVAIKNNRGSWLRSSFCHLSGQFAGFVEVMLEKDAHNQLIQDCHALSNLQITLTPAAEHEIQYDKQLTFLVTGNDRSGIVNDISSTLNTFDVNILSLDTQCESAPNWGSELFTAGLVLACAESVEFTDVKEAIEALADDLIVEQE